MVTQDIDAGNVRPGDRLPTHRDLARKLGVNVMTVSRAYAVALGHAQSQLERLGIEEPLEPGQSSGVLDDGMAWRLEITPYEEEPAEDSLLRAFLVKAIVTWRDRDQERQVALSSLRVRGAQ